MHKRLNKGLRQIIEQMERQDEEIEHYEGFDPAWMEMIRELKDLERNFVNFWEQTEKEIFEGQVMKIERLFRLGKLIGIEIEKRGKLAKLAVINECWECPHYLESPIRTFWACLRMGRRLKPGESIPSWCPLPDAPQKTEKLCEK